MIRFEIEAQLRYLYLLLYSHGLRISGPFLSVDFQSFGDMGGFGGAETLKSNRVKCVVGCSLAPETKCASDELPRIREETILAHLLG